MQGKRSTRRDRGTRDLPWACLETLENRQLLSTFPVQLQLTGQFDTPGTAYDVAIAGTHAYVSDATSGLQVIDVSAPYSPVREGGCGFSGSSIEAVKVSDTGIYLLDDEGSLRMLDGSVPGAPVSEGYFGSGVTQMAIVDSLAYVLDGVGSLSVVDVSDLSSPARLGQYSFHNFAYGAAVAVERSYAYVAEDGLVVVDVSDPANPRKTSIGGSDSLYSVSAIAVSGSRAYVADGFGLDVFDISNSALPTRIGGYAAAGAMDVAIDGPYAYLACGSGGVYVLDVTGAGSPTGVAHYDTAGFARGIDVFNGRTYVADNTEGLLILEMEPVVRIEDGRVVEGTGSSSELQFTVTLSKPMDEAVTVQFATADGTAMSSSDYSANSGVLTFVPGETSQVISVGASGDGIWEPSETMSVTLRNAQGIAIARATAIGTILNDDEDTRPPTPKMEPVVPPVPGRSGVRVKVIYRDPTKVDAATVGTGDIVVTGPRGFSRTPIIVKQSMAADGTVVTATYDLQPPGGTWDLSDNGVYTVYLNKSQVGDTDGHLAGTVKLGTFRVDTRPGYIAGKVYVDENANGKWDRGEKGITGGRAFLDGNHNFRWDRGEASAISDENGTYRVRVYPGQKNAGFLTWFVPPKSFRCTSLFDIRSLMPGALAYNSVSVSPGGTTGYNFGVTQQASLGGTVFLDTNGDRKLQSWEYAQSGVSVYLDSNDNGKLDRGELRQITGLHGEFGFDNLDPGEYAVRIVPDQYTTLLAPGGKVTVRLGEGEDQWFEMTYGKLYVTGKLLLPMGSPV